MKFEVVDAERVEMVQKSNRVSGYIELTQFDFCTMIIQYINHCLSVYNFLIIELLTTKLYSIFNNSLYSIVDMEKFMTLILILY